MEFKEAMRIWKRMCKTKHDCRECEMQANCLIETTAEALDASEAEAILAKWAEENPEKTIADDFLEKHPQATTYPDGTPFVCAKDCGYGEPEICRTVSEPCTQCWRRPLEEVEG